MSMRSSPLWLLVAALAAAHGEGLYKGDTPVLSITTEAQIPSGDNQKLTLIEYYATWCGHCQHFAPTYEAIAREARGSMPALTVAAVSCVDHEDICTRHEVHGYPTIKIYPGDVKLPPQAAPTKEGVLAFVRKHALERHIPLHAPGHDGVGEANAAPTAAAATAARGEGPPPSSSGGAASARPRQMMNLRNTSVHAALKLSAKALEVAPWLGTEQTGRDLAMAAKAFGIPDFEPPNGTAADDDLSMANGLKPRPMPTPVPSQDVLTAARYSLYHDVAAVLADNPSQAYARKRLGALRAWLHTLKGTLPHGRDGGATAAGVGEVLAALHGMTELPTREG